MGSESPPSGGNDAYCIAGREVPQEKSKAMQEMLLVTQWVSVFSLEGQIVILCKSQRTVKHVVAMPLREYQEFTPKLTYCILNPLLPFLTIGKKSLLAFYEVNCPVVPACLHLLVYTQGRFMVPGCSYFCLAVCVSSEPGMLVSSVLCSPRSHDRKVGWHMTLHRINSEMMP